MRELTQSARTRNVATGLGLLPQAQSPKCLSIDPKK
jgi:hypothetical protein